MPVVKSYYQTLYHCPVVELTGYCQEYSLPGRIFAYLDFGGPTGTAKDGLAEMMLAVAMKQGKLRPGQAVVEAGGGHFGHALAVAASVAGCPCVLVVSPEFSLERRAFLQRLGVRIVTASGKGFGAQVRCAEETARKCGGYFLNYFYNDECVNYHKQVTGPAILAALGENADAVVAGVGSGATITGVGEYIRQWQGFTRIVAVEPAESPALSRGLAGRHGIDGLGCGFVPELYNPYVVNDLIAVTTAQAKRAAQDVLLRDGIPACVSAGAVLEAARQLLVKKKCRAPVCIFSGRQ